MAYDAFISYSHAADGVLAPALEHGLERLARPWYRLRAMAVFRDQSDLALTPHLWSTIVTKLDQSRYLVVLASPESAASAWVNKEVSHWCDTRGTEALLLVVTGGDIAWDDATNDFTPGSTAVLPALRGRFTEEPLYHDLRWARDTPDLSLHLSRFRGAVALVASTIRGVAPDDLESEDVRLHRRARRLAKAAVTVVVVLALLASAAAIAAVRNAQRADRRAREAIARQVGLEALDEPASALDRALLLSLAAAGLDKDAGSDRFRSSRMLIGRYSRLDTILSAPSAPGALTSIRGLAFSADGRQLAATALAVAPGGQAAPTALRWQLGGGRTPPTQAAAPAGPVAFVAGSSDLAVGDAGQPLTVLPASGATAPAGDGTGAGETGATAPSGSTAVVALRPDQARAVVRDGDQVGLVDLTDGRRLASYAGTTAAPVLTSTTAIFPLAVGGLAIVDARTGAERARAAGPSAAMVAATEDGSAIVGLDSAGPTGTGGTMGSGLALTRWSMIGGQLEAAPPVTVAGVDADGVTRAVLSADGTSLLVVTGTGTTLVDPASGGVRASDAGATGVTAVDPTGRFVAMGGGRLAIWDLTTGQRVIAVPEPVNAIAWSGTCSPATGCRVVTVGRSLDVWDALVLQHVSVAEDTNAQAVAMSPDGTTVASAGWGPSVSIWQLDPITDDAGRREISPAGGPSAYDTGSGALARVRGDRLDVTAAGGAHHQVTVGTVDRVELLAGGTRALTVGSGGAALWNTSTGAAVALDPLCATDLVATSPGRTLVAALRTSDRATAVCDARTGTRVAASQLDRTIDPVGTLAVSDAGDIAVGGGEGAVARYLRQGDRLGSGTAIDVRFGGEPVEVTALSLGDHRLAAGLDPVTGADPASDATPGRALIWDVGYGGEPIVFPVDQRRVAAVALLGSDEELLAVAGRDDPAGPVTVQVAEAATRRRLGRALGGLTGAVTYLGGTDTEVVGVDGQGHAYTWAVDRDTKRDICAIVGRPLARDEWDAAVGGALTSGDYSPQCP
jgi:WD40 repeat protein